ncbi:MAG: hypothetical protein K1X85_00245 [Ignavibacteria bacterium]|nr:hypothetical protein [Ignavibacteria bacterium]
MKKHKPFPFVKMYWTLFVKYGLYRSFFIASILTASLMIFTDALHSQDTDTSYSLPDNISEGPHIIETDSGKVSVMFVVNEGAVEVRTSANQQRGNDHLPAA